MRLYDLTDQYNDLLELARDDVKGMDYTAMLQGMEGVIRDKLDNTCKVIRTLEAEAEGLKSETLRLSQRKTTIENHVARMREAMKIEMMRIGMDKHKSSLFSVSITKPRDRIEVTDITTVPSEYMKQSDPTVDKIAIMNAIKNGAMISGVTLVQGNSGLIIR